MSQILFEYPYSALATGILDIKQFMKELAALLEQSPEKGAEAWNQVELLYDQVSMKSTERDQLFQLINQITNYKKKPTEHLPPEKRLKNSESKRTEPPRATFAMPSDDDDTVMLNHRLIDKKTVSPSTRRISSQSQSQQAPRQITPKAEPVASQDFNTASNHASQSHAAASVLQKEPEIEEETIINEQAIKYQATGQSKPSSNSLTAQQEHHHDFSSDEDKNTNSPSSPPFWKMAFSSLLAIPWHIIFPIMLLSGFFTVLILQVIHLQKNPVTENQASNNGTILEQANVPNQQNNLSAASIDPPKTVLASTTPAITSSPQSKPIVETDSHSVESLYQAFNQALNTGNIEPLSQTGSALSYIETMMLTDPQGALTRQAKMEMAQKYLQLAKESRLNDQWDKAESFVEKAMYIRKEESTPSSLPEKLR